MTNNKMNVLQIVGDSVGGIRKHIHDIFRGLYSDFDFYYITSQNPDSVFIEEFDEIKTLVKGYEALNISKKPCIQDIRNIFQVYLFIKKYKIDIVHGHGAKGGLYARLAGKLAGCKVVYTPHGGVVHSMFGSFEEKIYVLMERFLCFFTDTLIFESNYTKTSFEKKFCCKRVRKFVNHNGIDVDQFISCSPIDLKSNDATKIGVFGMLRAVKGQSLVVKEVSMLINQGFNIEIHFFGNGEQREELAQYISQTRMDKYFIFHGEVNEVNRYMKAMNFVLIPSLFESFGYVAVESLALRKSLICSNQGGLGEIADIDNAFTFNPNIDGEMCKSIKNAVSTDRLILEQMQNTGYEKVVNEFSVSRMNVFLKTHYESMVVI